MDDPTRVQVREGVEELQEVVLDLSLRKALPPPEEIRHGLKSWCWGEVDCDWDQILYVYMRFGVLGVGVLVVGELVGGALPPPYEVRHGLNFLGGIGSFGYVSEAELDLDLGERVYR